MSQPGRIRQKQVSSQTGGISTPKDIDLGVEAGRKLAEGLGEEVYASRIDDAVKGLSGLGIAGAVGEVVPHLKGDYQSKALIAVVHLTRKLSPNDVEPLNQKFFGELRTRKLSEVGNAELAAAYLFASKSRAGMQEFRRWVQESGDKD
ncbi:MAG: hypothetical protein FJY77_05215, partial [Candidatus Altiarchaeales archaeon]|nr:hypothetical protein [Candidatus Altiarchaeales archaeon]